MKTLLPAGIGTIKQAQDFLKELHTNGETFHPNDDATALIGDPFTQEEGESLNALMLDIFNLPGNEEPEMMVFDPSLFLMAIEDHETNLVKYRAYLQENNLDDDSNGIDPVDLWIFMESIDEDDEMDYEDIATTTAQFCRCNNCMAIMVDENPDGQPEFTMKCEDLTDMLFITEGQDGAFWACPNCKTDGYLIDVTEEEQLRD